MKINDLIKHTLKMPDGKTYTLEFKVICEFETAYLIQCCDLEHIKFAGYKVEIPK